MLDICKRANLGFRQVQEKLLETAKRECDEMAVQLFHYIKDKKNGVEDDLKKWCNDEAPDIQADDFEVTKFEADELIMDKIKEKIRAWEQNHGKIKAASDNLTREFKNECQMLEQEAGEVTLMIEGDPIEDPMFFIQG